LLPFYRSVQLAVAI